MGRRRSLLRRGAELCHLEGPSPAKAEVVGTLFEDTINNRELCGEGDADVEAFIRAIDRIGYDGPWGVEIISHAHRARPIDEALTRAFDTAAASFRSARG